MLQQDAPDDFVIGTGETHSVREFVEEAFGYAGLDWKKHVKMSERYLRPLEVDVLIADTRKARTKLEWEPQIGFRDLVAIMVDADVQAAGLTPQRTRRGDSEREDRLLEPLAKLSHSNGKSRDRASFAALKGHNELLE